MPPKPVKDIDVAKERILAHIDQGNRVANSAVIIDCSQGLLKKAITDRALEELVTDAVICKREVGKNCVVYWRNQAHLAKLSPSDLELLYTKQRERTDDMKQRQEALAGMKAELDKILSEPPDGDLEQLIADAKVRVAGFKSDVARISSGDCVSKADMDAALLKLSTVMKAVGRRKRSISDAADLISESLNMRMCELEAVCPLLAGVQVPTLSAPLQKLLTSFAQRVLVPAGPARAGAIGAGVVAAASTKSAPAAIATVPVIGRRAITVPSAAPAPPQAAPTIPVFTRRREITVSAATAAPAVAAVSPAAAPARPPTTRRMLPPPAPPAPPPGSGGSQPPPPDSDDDNVSAAAPAPAAAAAPPPKRRRPAPPKLSPKDADDEAAADVPSAAAAAAAAAAPGATAAPAAARPRRAAAAAPKDPAAPRAPRARKAPTAPGPPVGGDGGDATATADVSGAAEGDGTAASPPAPPPAAACSGGPPQPAPPAPAAAPPVAPKAPAKRARAPPAGTDKETAAADGAAAPAAPPAKRAPPRPKPAQANAAGCAAAEGDSPAADAAASGAAAAPQGGKAPRRAAAPRAARCCLDAELVPLAGDAKERHADAAEGAGCVPVSLWPPPAGAHRDGDGGVVVTLGRFGLVNVDSATRPGYISRVHLVLEASRAGWMASSVGLHGSSVNGADLKRPRRLIKDGDVVVLAGSDLAWTLVLRSTPSDDAVATAAAAPQLKAGTDYYSGAKALMNEPSG